MQTSKAQPSGVLLQSRAVRDDRGFPQTKPFRDSGRYGSTYEARKALEKKLQNGRRFTTALAAALLGLALFLGVNALLSYLLIPYQFTRMKIHRIETQTFDDLVLGSSHSGAAVDPQVLSEQTGHSSFNAAAGGQYPRENYYLLRDACERGHKPERVILEYDPAYWIAYDDFNLNARYQELCMAFSGTRMAYFKDLCLRGDFRYVLMPWFQYRDQVGQMRQIAAMKQSRAYREYSAEPFLENGQPCREDGFTPIYRDALGNHAVPEGLSYAPEKEKYYAASREYLEKTVRLCDEEGIELIVVTTPVPETTKTALTDFYRESHERMQKLSERYGFSFFDYVMGEHAQAWDDGDFNDGEGHMYADTAARFTKLLAEDLKTMV